MFENGTSFNKDKNDLEIPNFAISDPSSNYSLKDTRTNYTEGQRLKLTAFVIAKTKKLNEAASAGNSILGSSFEEILQEESKQDFLPKFRKSFSHFPVPHISKIENSKKLLKKILTSEFLERLSRIY